MIRKVSKRRSSQLTPVVHTGHADGEEGEVSVVEAYEPSPAGARLAQQPREVASGDHAESRMDPDQGLATVVHT